MATMHWGRKETIIFPPHSAIYTYGAVFFAVILTAAPADATEHHTCRRRLPRRRIQPTRDTHGLEVRHGSRRLYIAHLWKVSHSELAGHCSAWRRWESCVGLPKGYLPLSNSRDSDTD